MSLDNNLGPHLPGLRTTSLTQLSGDKHFVFQQDILRSVWTIRHNLSKNPSVKVISTEGYEVEGSITYNNENNLTINFKKGLKGTAYLN